MNYRLRFIGLLLLCCALHVLAVGTIASGQTVPPATLNEQGDGNGSQPQTINSAAGRSDNEIRVPITREMTYREFIWLHGGIESTVQRAIEEGKQPSVDRTNFSTFLHTREDDEEAIHSILLDTFRHIKANQDKLSADLSDAYRAGYGKEQEDNASALNKASIQNEKTIIDEAMHRFERELTAEDFKKLDTYIYRWGDGGKERVIKRAPGADRHKITSSTAIRPDGE